MKRLMKTFVLVAAAAMALTSCENEAMNDGIATNDTYTLTFVADAPEGTRTSVSIDEENETATFAWSEDDKIGFYSVANGVDSSVDNHHKKNNSNEAVINATSGAATFTVKLEAATNATGYNIGAFYPGNSWVSHADENHFKNVKVKIPASQTLTAGSYDPNADLMMSKGMYVETQIAESAAQTLEFQRLAAIGRMNIKGVTAGETIKSVKLTFNEEVLNGDVTLDFTAGSETATYANEGENYVELKGTMTAATENVVYFTCFPGEYSGAYTINVETDKAIYTKSGNATKPLTFTAGNVLGFGATFTAENREEKVTTTWTLVTDASTLAAGDKIIIAAKDYASAMSTTQNGNNRAKANITKNGNTITTPGSDVQIFTLEAGTVSGTWAFYTGSGYIYAASSSKNYLRTQDTNNANGSWAITIASDGTATVKAQGTNTRNWLRYNNSNSIFSCYSSGQMDIYLYKLGSNAGSGDSGETPEPVQLVMSDVTCYAKTENSLTFTWARVENADNYEIYFDGVSKGTTPNNSYKAENLEADTEHTIAVKAVGDGTNYTTSEAKTCTASTEAAETGGEATTKTMTLSGTFTKNGTEMSLTQNGITVTQYKVSGSTAVNGSYNTPSTLRVYKGHALKFEGKTITKIEITYLNSYYGNSMTANTGTLTTSTASGGTHVWTGEADEVIITNAAKSDNVHLRTSKIVVTYKD